MAQPRIKPSANRGEWVAMRTIFGNKVVPLCEVRDHGGMVRIGQIELNTTILDDAPAEGTPEERTFDHYVEPEFNKK